jgi:hypothetical protein
VSIEIVRVSDIELAQLARTGGLRSIETRVLRRLRKRRARDYQAYAFALGGWHYFIGSVPDARTKWRSLVSSRNVKGNPVALIIER